MSYQLHEKQADTEKSHLPWLTIGIISCNRFHYLQATFESAHMCIHYPKIQWIVVDNASIEPGLRDYLKKQDWINELILRDKRSPKTEHVSAMNEIVTKAVGDVVLIWPEDVQFIVNGDWMLDCVEILMKHPWIGSMGLNCIRGITIQKYWTWRRWMRWKMWGKEIVYFRNNFRRSRLISSSRGYNVRTFGWTASGVIGSGIPSLTRTEVWRKLGPWKAPGARPGLIDSSGGGETGMLIRWERSGLVLQRALSVLPVAADIVTDTIGCKAKVRGNKRYGVYIPPSEGKFYYEIYKQLAVQHLSRRKLPIAFEDFVRPIGYQLPLDNKGNLLKASINDSIIVQIDNT